MLMNWLRKYKNTILIVLVSGFVLSTFVGFGLYMTSGGGLSEAVAEVNGEKIPYKSYTALYNQVVNNRRDKGEDLNPEALNQIKQEVVQSLIQQTVFTQEAKRYGIKVTDMELAQSLAGIPAFQKQGKFDAMAYMQALQYALHTTPEEFEETQRKQIAISRLRYFVLSGVKVTDRELDLEYQQALFSLTGKDKEKFLKDFGNNRDKFREQIRQEKAAQILNRWYQQLGTNLKIRVRLDEIESRMHR